MKIMIALVAALLLAAPVRAETTSPYTELLREFVDDAGLVDYAGLKANHARLDAIVQGIAAQDVAEYEVWDDPVRLAFWINTYNVLTLKLIVDRYPIQPAPGRQAYPANSIQQIPGAWTGVRFAVMGKERTLDEIEHQVIRVEFSEPRVHFALVCAAVSCPPLRREAYQGATLDQQLGDQGHRFFADLRNFFIDRDGGEVWVSQIIEWFGEDFAPDAIEKNGRFVGERIVLLVAASPYIDTSAKEFVEDATHGIAYYDYDWTLNPQTP
jgi:hypothetical protein